MPFTDEELNTLTIRRQFEIELLHVCSDHVVMKVTNHSKETLPDLTVSIRGEINFGFRLDVSSVAPGQTKELPRSMPRGMLQNKDFEICLREPTGPEERQFFAELKNKHE